MIFDALHLPHPPEAVVRQEALRRAGLASHAARPHDGAGARSRAGVRLACSVRQLAQIA